MFHCLNSVLCRIGNNSGKLLRRQMPQRNNLRKRKVFQRGGGGWQHDYPSPEGGDFLIIYRYMSGQTKDNSAWKKGRETMD